MNEGKVVGPTLSLYVNAGDTVKVRSYAKYTGVPGSGGTPFVIADEVTDGFGLVSSGETGAAYSAVSSLLGSGSAFLGFSSDPDLPKAYLNYHYFDTDHNYITSGFVQVSAGANGNFEELMLSFTADQQGYVYIYVANETQADFNVFFDDVEVEHSYGPIVAAQSYYPFGLTFGEYQRVLSKLNYFKYNGKEEQPETDLLDYGSRYYDAALGRFTTQDPYAYVYQSYSPYGYALNNPIRFEDTDGEGPGDRVRFAKSLVGTPYLMGYNNGDSHWKTAKTPAAMRLMDCSELVYRVLAADGVFGEVYYDNTLGLRGTLNRDGDNGMFIRSQSPEVGDIFLWRDQEATYGHTGIVTGIVEDEEGNIVGVEITHASGSADEVVTEVKDLSWFTSKTGWQGFYRPKIESEDGKENTIGTRSYDLRGMTAEQKVNLINDVLLDLQKSIERSKARREAREKRKEERRKRKEERENG